MTEPLVMGAQKVNLAQLSEETRVLPSAGIATSPPRVATNVVGKIVDTFPSISLDETNKLARMMSRIDNKYTVTEAQFRRFINAVTGEFAVLEIDDLRQFAYDSCYYDDNYACYLDHHQGKRQRFKVRTREYVNSGDKFFEVKVKGLRGATEKHRVECDYLISPQIKDEHMDLLCGVHQTQYRKQMPYAMRPTLIVGYKRCTLVALGGGARVTIDYGLNFAHPAERDRPIQIGNDFIIIETKSGDGKGIADQVLKNLKIRKASNCSKYCIGVSLTGAVKKSNNFLSTIKRARQTSSSRTRLGKLDRGIAEPQTAGGREIRMRKIDAIILIFGLISVAAWVVLSGRNGFKGNNAMIVARSVSVAATMEGQIDNAPPVVGSKFNSNELLVHVQNNRIDRTRLVEFESQVDFLKSEITSVTSQQRELTELLETFEKRANAYANWMQRDVHLRKLVNMRQLDVARKRSQMKAEEVGRLTRLLKRQHTSEVNVNVTRSDAAIAKSQVEVATAELERSELLLQSLQDEGVFSEDGDANYWAKSADVLRMRFSDNRTRIELLKAQLARAVAQANAEREHLNTNFSEEHRAPFSGVVNATFVTQGARVALGTSLLQVLDCARPTVVVPIPEHRIGEFAVGMKATVYPIDSEGSLAGTVIHISSGPLLGHDTSIQLEQDLTLSGVRAIVGFDDHGSLDALSESCETARKAVAVIHTESLYKNVSKWVSSYASKFGWSNLHLDAVAAESSPLSARP